MWILTCDEEVHIIYNVCAEQEGAKQRVDRHADWPWPVLGGELSDACHHISPEQVSHTPNAWRRCLLQAPHLKNSWMKPHSTMAHSAENRKGPMNLHSHQNYELLPKPQCTWLHGVVLHMQRNTPRSAMHNPPGNPTESTVLT